MSKFNARYEFEIDMLDGRFGHLSIDQIIIERGAEIGQRVVMIKEWSVRDSFARPRIIEIDAEVIAELMLQDGKPIIDAEYVDVTPAAELPTPPKLIEGPK